MRAATEFSKQPHLRELPVAKHGLGGHVQGLGDFLRAQSSKEAQLDDLALAFVDPGERTQRIVQRHEVALCHLRHVLLVERDVLDTGAAFGSLPLTREVDQDPAHQPRRPAQKVRAVVPTHTLQIDQTEIALVDQAGDLQRMSDWFAPQVPAGHLAQFRVHQWRHDRECVFIAPAPGVEQRGDWMRCHTGTACVEDSTPAGHVRFRGPFPPIEEAGPSVRSCLRRKLGERMPTYVFKGLTLCLVIAGAATGVARVAVGDESQVLARGEAIFFDETLTGLGGNGRACSTCHVAEDAFQLTPAHAFARLRTLQKKRLVDPQADDPLFRPIDADDFRVNGESANDYTTLTQDGLVRITLPLPSNVRLVSPVGNPATAPLTDETSVDIWRSVPSVLDVAITGPDGVLPEWIVASPNRRGGYQLDARKDTLQEQALGAFVDHAQVAVLPDMNTLDDLAAFQNSLFSSPRVARLATAMAAGTSPLPDPDRGLNRLERQGKAVFERSCAHCHGNPEHPSTTTSLPQSIPGIAFNRYHDVRTSCPRPLPPPAGFPEEPWLPCSPNVVNKVRTYEITLPNGAAIRRSSSDPGRLLLIGDNFEFQKFDVPNLRGISRTAPYFINNGAKTLEDVLQQYRAFFAQQNRIATTPAAPGFGVISTDGINRDRPFTPDEEAALLAYLRTL